jgi:hypothetical protein
MVVSSWIYGRLNFLQCRTPCRFGGLKAAARQSGLTLPSFARLNGRGVDSYPDDAVRQVRRWRAPPDDVGGAGDGLRHTRRAAYRSRKGLLPADEGRLRQDGNAERPLLLRDHRQTAAIGDAEASVDPKRSANCP